MYFHFDMGAFAHGTQHPITPPPTKPFTLVDAVGVLAESFYLVATVPPPHNEHAVLTFSTLNVELQKKDE